MRENQYHPQAGVLIAPKARAYFPPACRRKRDRAKLRGGGGRDVYGTPTPYHTNAPITSRRSA